MSKKGIKEKRNSLLEAFSSCPTTNRLVFPMKIEIKTNVGPNKENRKNATMKKSSSRPLLKDKKYNNLSKSKKRPSRPTSGRSNSKNRPGSGKKDSSFRSQNRSRSRDRSKQLVKTKDSSHQKIDDNALLKNFKG